MSSPDRPDHDLPDDQPTEDSPRSSIPSGQTPSPSRSRGRAVTVVLLGVTVAVIALFAVAFGVVVYFLQAEPTAEVAEGSFLRVPLGGVITDAPPPPDIFTDPVKLPPTATEIAEAIRRAANDDRISGVYLEMQAPQLGWGLSREIRTALVALREADKPCVAYGEVYTTRDYYIASACDEIIIAPSGVPLVIGQSLSITYYKDALAYLGVEPRIVHVGDYKTAIEPYERMEPSDAAKESYEFLLDGIWGTVAEEIAASRGMSEEEFWAILDRPSLSPRRAVESGLFTAVGYSDAVQASLSSLGDEGWRDTLTRPVVESKEDREDRFTSLSEYRKDADDGPEDVRIAVIYAEGTILSGEGGGGLFGADGLFDGKFRKWMRDAREDDTVKAVVIRVNSPGGSALAADMMDREVQLMKEAGKPVVVSMADYAASGGYMMSAHADHIVAQPTTITGSIGVFGMFFDTRGTWEKLQLAEHVYKRGSHSDLLFTTSEHDETDRQILQEFVDDTYGDFVAMVAEGRGVSADEIESVAQGRVWTGTQGLDGRNLVDELGGLDEALAKARELAKVEEAGVVRLPEKKGFFDVLVEEMANAESPKVEVELDIPVPGIEEALQELALIRAFQASGGAVAYLPGRPTVR